MYIFIKVFYKTNLLILSGTALGVPFNNRKILT
jgi:hypothetical protein